MDMKERVIGVNCIAKEAMKRERERKKKSAIHGASKYRLYK